MNQKTLFLAIGVLALFGLGIAGSLNRAYSDDGRKTNVPPVGYSSDGARATKPTLQDLRAEINALRADVQKVLALLQKNPDGGQHAEAHVPAAEVADIVTIFKLENVPPHGAAEVIQTVILDARVSVLPDENQLVVVANAADTAKAAQTIAQLDRPRQQVQIESWLYEVTVDDLQQVGLSDNNDPQGSITSRLGKHVDFQATIDALSATQGARLLARPKIRSYDRTMARFQSVQEVPIQMLTQTSQGGAIGTTQFREAGITMEVTPQITTGGRILLEVQPEFSVMQGLIDGQPVIDRRSASTTVAVKSGEPIVISGLRSQRHHLPDAQPEANRRETELLIIIKAQIVDVDDE